MAHGAEVGAFNRRLNIAWFHKFRRRKDEEEDSSDGNSDVSWLEDAEHEVVTADEDGSEDEDDGSRCYGLKHRHPNCYEWFNSRLGTPGKVLLIVTFLVVNSIHGLLEENVLAPELQFKAFRESTRVNLSSVLVVINGLSLFISLSASVLMEGGSVFSKIWDMHAFWRFFVVALMFQIAFRCFAIAYLFGMPDLVIQTVGYSYMPFSALVSFFIFRRSYGKLEWLSLLCMSLAAANFIYLRYRCASGSCEATKDHFHVSLAGSFTLVGSVFMSCMGSIFAERIFKDRSLGLMRVHEGLRHDHYYVHKVHLDSMGLLISVIIWITPVKFKIMLNGAIHFQDDWWGHWQRKHVIFVLVTVAQWWMAGLIAKRFSTVVKALVQSVSIVLVLLAEDRVLDKFMFYTRLWPTLCMAIIVVISAVMFQTGRINIKMIRRMLHLKDTESRTQEISLSAMKAGIHDITHRRGSKDESDDENGKDSSILGFLARYGIVIAFISLNVCRQLFNSVFLFSTMITLQSFSVAVSFFSGVLSHLLICQRRNRQKGSTYCMDLKEAWDPKWLLKAFFPIGFLASLTQALSVMAFGMGISGALSAVLGYLYLPVASFLSRYILGDFYMWLQWLAIAVITLNAFAFGFLNMMAPGAGSQDSIFAILAVVGSACCSAANGLAMEKFIKGSGKPFMMQKLRADVGQFLWSMIMLPIIGFLPRSRPGLENQAYWNYRPLTKACSWQGICGKWLDGNFAADPSASGYAYNFKVNDGAFSYSTPGYVDYSYITSAMLGNETLLTALGAHDFELADPCVCGKGVWVCWDDWRIWVILGVTIAYFFTISLIVTRYGSVMRAVFENIAFVCLYFIAEPFLKPLLQPGFEPTLYDGAKNMSACLHIPAGQLFVQAGDELKRLSQATEAAANTNGANTYEKISGDEEEDEGYISDS